MKRTMMVMALILSVLVVSTVQIFAQAAIQSTNKPVELNFEFNSKWLTKYVSPFDNLVHNKPVVQSEVTAWMKLGSAPGKFYADVWHSTSLNGAMNSDRGDELDYTIGWKGNLWKGISLNLWATYFDFVPIGTIPENRDQVRFFAEFDRKFEVTQTQSLTPFVRFEVPWGIKDYKDSSGLRVYPGLKYVWEFFPGWSVCQKANLLFDDGAVGLKPGIFGDYRVGLSWQTTKWLAIEPFSFRVVGPFQNSGDDRKTQTIFSAGFSAKF